MKIQFKKVQALSNKKFNIVFYFQIYEIKMSLGLRRTFRALFYPKVGQLYII